MMMVMRVLYLLFFRSDDITDVDVVGGDNQEISGEYAFEIEIDEPKST